MDKFIANWPAHRDWDLMCCDGVAYQADMATQRVPYDASYLAKCDAYAGSDIAKAVNAGRCALLARHLPAGCPVLDYGAGSGAFVRAALWHGFGAAGFDVIPEASERLHQAGHYADAPERFPAVCLWDVLEHIEDPGPLLASIKGFLFVSLPIFSGMWNIRKSKHYRPGEHLYYFSHAGFVAWMRLHGFRMLENSEHEIAAGRDAIGAYAFRRVEP